MSGLLFMILSTCFFLLVIDLLAVEQSTGIDIDILLVLNCLFLFLLIAWIYSYFSEKITANSLDIGEDAYDSLWYNMPIKQQKAVILIVGRAQREFRLDALGMADCSFVTFLAVTIHFEISF